MDHSMDPQMRPDQYCRKEKYLVPDWRDVICTQPSLLSKSIKMKRFQIKCRRCRQWLVSEESIVDCHGNAVQSQDDMSSWYCGGAQGEVTTHTHLFISSEQPPPFVLESVVKSNYTQGKVMCPRCQGRLGSFDFVRSARTCNCRQTVLPPIHLLMDRLDFLDVHQQRQNNVQIVSPVHLYSYSQHEPTTTMTEIVDHSWGDGRGGYELEDDEERGRDLDICTDLKDCVGEACRLEENTDRDAYHSLDSFPTSLVSRNPQENRTCVTVRSERDQAEEGTEEESIRETTREAESVIATERESITETESKAFRETESQSIRETERARRERQRERRERERINRKVRKEKESAKRERKAGETTEPERTETETEGETCIADLKRQKWTTIYAQNRNPSRNSSRTGGWQGTQNFSHTRSSENEEVLCTHDGHVAVEKPHRCQTTTPWQRDKDRREREALLEKQRLEEEDVLCDHTCPVCMEVMLSPHLTLPCRHNFCDGCLRRLAMVTSIDKTDCPMCRQRIAQCQPNVELQREINTLYPAHIRTRQREEKRKRNQRYKHMSLPQMGFPHNFLSRVPLRRHRPTMTLGVSAAVVGRQVAVLVLFVVVMFLLSYVGMMICRYVLSWLAPLYDFLMEVLTGERLWSRFMGVESRTLTVSTVFVLYLLCACVMNHFHLFNP